MLELRRLRLLRELSERGTIAAVADALQFTPSAVSQQLASLEREAGVRLLERAGRGVRLTDAALVLVEHADALLERAAIAEADLAAAAGAVTGRVRIAGFQSLLLRIALPAIEALARDSPRLRCEAIEAEPEHALPALALGDVDLVLGDEWQHQPWRMPAGVQRHDLLQDPVHLVLPARHPAARRHPDAVPLAEVAGERRATLDSIRATAVDLDKDDAAELGEDLADIGSPGARSTAAALGGATRIWLDRKVEGAALDGYLTQVRAPAAWSSGLDGTGGKVAVLDTGVDDGNPALAGQVDEHVNFTDGPSAADGNGHGTHVASLVAGTGAGSDGARQGIAAGADLISGKVLDDEAAGVESWAIAGMEWAVAQGADVVNISLG